MLTIIAFLLTTLGSVNWLLIGLLQYDFVAGIFGTQANIFSRIVYTLVGVSAIYVTCVIIAHKGRLTEGSKQKKTEQ